MLTYRRRPGDAHAVGPRLLSIKRISVDLAERTLCSIRSLHRYPILGQCLTFEFALSISLPCTHLLRTACVVFYSTTWTQEACDSFHHFQPVIFATLQMLCQAAFIYITWELLGQIRLLLILAIIFVAELVILAVGVTRFDPL